VSEHKERKWSLGGFAKSVAVGAVSGAASYGIGELFVGATPGIATEIGRVMYRGFA